jgi:hypothetical protein
MCSAASPSANFCSKPFGCETIIVPACMALSYPLPHGAVVLAAELGRSAAKNWCQCISAGGLAHRGKYVTCGRFRLLRTITYRQASSTTKALTPKTPASPKSKFPKPRRSRRLGVQAFANLLGTPRHSFSRGRYAV